MDKSGIDNFIEKRLAEITLFVGIVGFLPNIFYFGSLIPIDAGNTLLDILYILKPASYLNILPLDFFYALGLPFNLFDMAFHFGMIFVFIRYKNTGELNMRWVLFFFAVILFSQLMSLVVFAVNLLMGESTVTIRWFLFSGTTVVWAYIAYRVMRIFAFKPNEVEEGTYNYNEEENEYERTQKNERLLHHVLDSILSLMICTGSVLGLFFGFFLELEQSIGGNFSLFFTMIIGKLLYYPFFETVFGATPAKFLTGSVVLRKESNARLTLGTAIGRTFSRIVPFEPFSFLGQGEGWHDKWSATKVVKPSPKVTEKREGLQKRDTNSSPSSPLDRRNTF